MQNTVYFALLLYSSFWKMSSNLLNMLFSDIKKAYEPNEIRTPEFYCPIVVFFI